MAWMLEARASETCAVRSVSCPRAFSGVADVGVVVLAAPVSWCGRGISVGDGGAASSFGVGNFVPGSGCAGEAGCG